MLAAAILALIVGVQLPTAIARPLAHAVDSVLGSSAPGSPGATLPGGLASPPGGVSTFRDSQGRVWTWVPSGPQGPHWLLTGPHGAVSQVSPAGKLLSGASLGAIAFPIIRVSHQGNETIVETLDGRVYVLQNSPDPGPDQQDVQDVANEILSNREGVNNVAFVQRSKSEPRPDLVTYDDLKPGSTLHFVEVKNLNVDDDGQVNAWTGAGNIADAVQRQGADEVVVVLDTAPDPNSLLNLIQRTNQLMASKGISGTVTIAVRESGDIGVGPLHEAWTGELGAGVSSDEVSDLDNGEEAAQEDQPGDDQAGEPDPENPVLGGGDGDGGDGGDDGFGGE